MTMDEYAAATAAQNGSDTRTVDENGRLDTFGMTDREIAEETLRLLRGLSDGMTAIMEQIAPTLTAMKETPIGRMMGIR